MSAFFTAFLLVSLVVLLLSLYLATPSDPPSPPSTRPEERLEQCVRALGTPDAPSSGLCSPNGDASQRRLLSMGAAAISPLLHCLERLDPLALPLSYSPSQQRGIELVLTDFGPQVLTHIARFYQRPLRSTPALPALSRVLNALGPLCLPPLANNQPLPIAITAALLQSIPPEHLTDTLARCEPLLSDTGLLWTATALLPLHTRPHLRDLPACAPRLWSCLQSLCPHPDPACAPPTSSPAPSDVLPSALNLDADLAELDLPDDPPDDLLLRLAQHLADPRVQERLIRLVHTRTEAAAVAFKYLAIHRVRGLQPLLNGFLRQPSPLTPSQRLSLKQAVRAHPEPCTQTLTLLLLSEHPLWVMQAADMLCALDDPSITRILLKATYRHRHTHLEPHLWAALLCRPWPTIHTSLLAALRDDDREVQGAALELLGLYGGCNEHPDDAPTLLAWLLATPPHISQWNIALNALEFMGPTRALPALQKTLSNLHELHPAFPHLHRCRLLLSSEHPRC